VEAPGEDMRPLFFASELAEYQKYAISPATACQEVAERSRAKPASPAKAQNARPALMQGDDGTLIQVHPAVGFPLKTGCRTAGAFCQAGDKKMAGQA